MTMKRIAAHTLGCKVNQYDTQAMLELFQQAGFSVVSMDGDAEVYLINTCTVTGTGDKKSLQLIRRIRREHPASRLIVCGCLAQLRGGELLSLGADLILGTQNRGKVVDLLREVESRGEPLCAVAPLEEGSPFEPLCISTQAGHTRAVLKIQEGCRNRCAYCVIPAVRGPIRSRPLPEIREEVRRLRDAGFREVVLTGIHLSSYGKDFASGVSLPDAIRAVQETEGILRIRLGSLEPGIATEAFAAELKKSDKLCPQFHLALQSGSDSVLARMRRRYNAAQYLRAVDNLRRAFPHAAFTTDILTGFPGESDAEYRETEEMIRKVGFARIHVFPFSARPGTPAAAMEGQLPASLKEERARKLIALGNTVAREYLRSWVGLASSVLPEERVNGCWEGYTPEYIRVRLAPGSPCSPGVPAGVRLTAVESRGMRGEMIEERI